MSSVRPSLNCPLPDAGDGERISLAHGEGGRLSRLLVERRVVAGLGEVAVGGGGDSALLDWPTGPVAVTADAHVVSPLFFPGGDIGSLAVFGAVNDLAVSGARPLSLTLSFLLEEGLAMATFDTVVASVRDAAHRTGVRVVTGDTKVVPRGAADGMFVVVTGIGNPVEPISAGPSSMVPGDVLLTSGPLGRHGVAVLSVREELGFDPPPRSDSAPLFDSVDALRSAGVPVRAMRDATRGGATAVLHEWAEASGLTLVVDEHRLPVTPEVRGACELLGLDPLQIANEGTMLVAVPPQAADEAVAALRSVPESAGAAVVGEVRPQVGTPVLVRRVLGREQPLDEPTGAPLPRIC